MTTKTTEITERERLRRLRQTEENARKNDPKFAAGKQHGPKVDQSFGLVQKLQKKTGRGA